MPVKPATPATPATDDARKIVVGETAPEFSLPDTTGTPRRLSELTKDSSCVVLFYRGHW
jgi:peroxiredoxin